MVLFDVQHATCVTILNRLHYIYIKTVKQLQDMNVEEGP